MASHRRLVFGEVADLYDRHRPTYPPALIDDLVERAGVGEGQRVLEVGAGTGKATELFARRGVAVVAVEPSGAMAAVARRNLARFSTVELVESDFERFDPAGERFPLLYSAQAWHWIDPAVRYQRAAAALSPGGLLAAFWNRAAWGRSELRDALAATYAQVVPAMETGGPMHPANPSPEGDDEDWEGEIDAIPEFGDAEVRRYVWDRDYTAAEYAGLIGTVSEVRLLDEQSRQRLLEAVQATIAQHGGTLRLPWVTRVCLARARRSAS